jgi:hypothetical protein
MVHPTPSVQAIPTVFPTKQTGQTGPKPKPSVQGTPMVHPTPSVQAIPTVFPTKTPHNAVPNATPNKKPGMVPTAKPSLGFFDRIRNYFRGDQDKIIEPGIRNKEVEAYRTDDAKEVEYKDTIIQDDKDVTLPKKYLK